MVRAAPGRAPSPARPCRPAWGWPPRSSRCRGPARAPAGPAGRGRAGRAAGVTVGDGQVHPGTPPRHGDQHRRTGVGDGVADQFRHDQVGRRPEPRQVPGPAGVGGQGAGPLRRIRRRRQVGLDALSQRQPARDRDAGLRQAREQRQVTLGAQPVEPGRERRGQGQAHGHGHLRQRPGAGHAHGPPGRRAGRQWITEAVQVDQDGRRVLDEALADGVPDLQPQGRAPAPVHGDLDDPGVDVRGHRHAAVPAGRGPLLEQQKAQ